uniref:Uncharacterized protein n=1 Tax=Vespula pensylvanica TaxID=30213 RepID=A0A834NKX5_VESPE|nr:hypothetical protein H0235_013088 [Vespula pensylvanica]
MATAIATETVAPVAAPPVARPVAPPVAPPTAPPATQPTATFALRDQTRIYVLLIRRTELTRFPNAFRKE